MLNGGQHEGKEVQIRRTRPFDSKKKKSFTGTKLLLSVTGLRARSMLLGNTYLGYPEIPQYNDNEKQENKKFFPPLASSGSRLVPTIFCSGLPRSLIA